jgi:hypothetical protein
MPKFGLLFLGLMVCVSSCKQSAKSTKPVPEEKFVAFYADLLILENDTAAIKSDPLELRRKTDSLYGLYEIDSVSVRRTMAAYNENNELWQEFIQKVMERLQKLEGQNGQNVPIPKVPM